MEGKATDVTPEEYLEIDRAAETKSEYYNGEMFALSRGTLAHGILTSALTVAVGKRLAGQGCVTVSGDVRIRVGEPGLYTYPDLAVVCGTPLTADGHSDTLLNPVLIAEVLSPSTESYDRGKKFEHYRTIPSLRHYVLVSQTTMQVEVFTVGEGGLDLHVASEPGDLVRLSAIAVEFPVEELYEGIDVTEALQARSPTPRTTVTDEKRL